MGVTENAKDGYHHGNLREALLTAAVELIEEGGVQSLSLRKAAKRAGVSSGAPYHHFKNRAALMAAIAGDGFRLLGEEMEGIDDSEPGAALSQCGAGYVRFAQRHPAHFRVMFRPELADHSEFPELAAASEPVFGYLVQRVMRAQAAGAAPKGDPEPIVMLAWSMVHGLASLMIDGQVGSEDFDKVAIKPEDMAQVTIGQFESLLGAAAAHQRHCDD